MNETDSHDTTLSVEDARAWYAVRDMTRTLDISQVHAHRLIHAGRVRAVQTRLGWLIDPASVAALAETRRERTTAEAAAC